MFCTKIKVLLGVCALLLFAGVANADFIGTYVDADPSNTTPSTAFSVTESDTDNLWHLDTSRTYGGNGNVLASNTWTETSPMLTTTVSGLANGKYDVYAVYWRHTSDFWCIDAGLEGGSMIACDSTGTPTGNPGDADKVQYSILLGQANVTGGSFAVNVTDHANAVRGWYDGVSYQESVVPEPSAVVMIFIGLLGLLAYAWRKRK